jgi:hypothetical protein
MPTMCFGSSQWCVCKVNQARELTLFGAHLDCLAAFTRCFHEAIL